ncbi:HEPN domain-containing protein [Salinibacter sp.]|uniref:HEPN domain-containing protein n=1 Tax=Salinibacter sp. TaxID=2065818 RepID=UPI0021E98220|nr:HEPN domain-containing protein [Salinibacter sp.]
MPRFLFRLTFFVKDGTLVDSESESIQIELPGSLGTVELSAQHAESLKDASWFNITGRGYKTEEKARRKGKRIRGLLQFLQVERKMDIDLGDDQKTGRIGDAIKERMKASSEEDLAIHYSTHGLAVYPEDPKPLIVSGHAEATVKPNWERDLQELLSDLSESDLSLDKRTSLACSLYGTAQSANSQRATFLSLMSAIESLLKPDKRSDRAVSLVDSFIEEVKSSCLEESERDSLADTLKWLRQDSITRTGVELVEEHLGEAEYDGMQAPGFFRQCYGIRSELLHEGEPEDESIDVSKLANSLDRMVSDLLTSVCGAEDVG